METWERIDDFPAYMVSNEGRVINEATGRILKESTTRTGIVKVGMVAGGVQYTRSVALMVAEKFVEGRNDIFDTPVHIDGNRNNNVYSNLVWRPRWFAWKYTRQFSLTGPHHDRGPVMDLTDGRVYSNFLEASMASCILIDDIWKSAIYKKPVFPTDQTFKVLI